MDTRTSLEQQHYTFHPGKVDDQGLFHFANPPHSEYGATHLGDLARTGFVKVNGGVMEPPRDISKVWLTLGALGMAVGIGFALDWLKPKPHPPQTA